MKRTKLIAKVTIVLLTFFILFLLGNYAYFHKVTFENIEKSIEEKLDHISSDLVVKDGFLNATQYYQDSTTPLDKPLYIMTNEGFIIERLNTVKGFLDISDFVYANSFQQPQTITTPVDNTWRVFSKTVRLKDEVLGTILVAYFDPNPQILSEIDELLISSANKIYSLITIRDKTIVVDNIQPKQIHHRIHYSVVDSFNKVLAEDGGPPMMIDRSFVAEVMKNNRLFQVPGEKGEIYLMKSKTISDGTSNLAVIVYGESIRDINILLTSMRNFATVSGLITLFSILGGILIIFGQDLKKLIHEAANELQEVLQKNKYISPEKISFDKKYSVIQLDDYSVPIEYGSKQYDLCKTLFSSPKKRWEHDEIFEKNHLHENDQKERTFYDASIRINNKMKQLLDQKLILYEDRTFCINPNFLSKVVRT